MQRRERFKRAGAAAGCTAVAIAAAAFAAQIPASGTLDLASEADVTFVGEADRNATGFTTAPAGDVNGDGVADVIIGASQADPAGRTNAGSAYVVFGRAGLERTIALGSLGASGFRIDGATAGDRAGFAVAGAGDVNGDGLGDLIVGAPRRDTTEVEDTGTAFVVFGRKETAAVDLAALGEGGFRITGAAEHDQTGVTVAGAGDVNGDGLADVVVGAPRADAHGRRDAGVVGVVFGKKDSSVVALSDPGANGFRIEGAEPGVAGISVGAVGDMNGDKRPEILVGAPTAGRAMKVNDELRFGRGLDPGAAYVVWGRATTTPVDLAQLGDQGFSIAGEQGENLGFRVAGLGDLSGDGVPDVAVGAPLADRNERVDSGSVVLVYGRTSAGALKAAELGNGGSRIDGATAGDQLGYAVAPGGDFNLDGKADVLVGALRADPLSREDSGAAYLVYGPRSGDAALDVGAFGTAGLRFAGPVAGGEVASVSMPGDVSGDGTPDVMVGVVKGAAPEPAPSPTATPAPGATPTPTPTATATPAPPRERPGTAYLISAPVPPTPTPQDPGAVEEVQMDGCQAAENVEFVIDDSGSMESTDNGRLRVQAIELILAKPRNVGRVIGALEFGDDANPVFRPEVVDAPGVGSNQDALRATADRLIRADNGSTNYNAAFDVLADENPTAAGRIFLTDGEHNVGEFLNGHRNGPPTFVVGLGIGRRGAAAERLRRIAAETKGSYFPNVKADTLQPVMNAIDSTLNCDIELDAFVDNLTAADDEIPPNEVDLEDGTNSADINVSWNDEDDEFDPEKIEVLDDEDEVVAKLGRKTLNRAIRYSSKRRQVGALSVRGEEGDTFFSLRLNGITGAKKLRVLVEARKVRRGARLHTQVAQSRRRG